MNISHLRKAAVLAALYNGSKPQGLGVFQFDPTPMTEEEAQAILNQKATSTYFDYLKGRVMKINLGGDELDTRLYNRDNGEGKAESILAKL